MDGDTADDEGVTDDQQGKKKSKKEKIGFRDRKVRPCQIFIETMVIKIVALKQVVSVILSTKLSSWSYQISHIRQFFFNFIFVFHVHDHE